MTTSAASDAGSQAAWLLVNRPSNLTELAPALLARLGPLQSLRDDAESDPAAFVRAYFDAIENAVSDAAGDVREDEAYRAGPEAFYGVGSQFSPR